MDTYALIRPLYRPDGLCLIKDRLPRLGLSLSPYSARWELSRLHNRKLKLSIESNYGCIYPSSLEGNAINGIFAIHMGKVPEGCQVITWQNLPNLLKTLTKDEYEVIQTALAIIEGDRDVSRKTILQFARCCEFVAKDSLDPLTGYRPCKHCGCIVYMYNEQVLRTYAV